MLFPIIAVSFIFQPTLYKGSLFSTPFPTLVISCLFDNSHPNRCEMIALFSFDLHFSDD